ncbi:MAG: hypothetical protein CMO55_00910 [Verrucomicrobiales bacterium]|nr:hypothetical protein [Verrucomicrobiales bacterium]
MKIVIGLLSAVVFLCLSSQVSGQSKIVGGEDAANGAYPWMVALVKKAAPDPFQGQFCGGSLIHENWVLTAAHCVDSMKAEDIEVWVGAHDLSNTTGAERRDIRAIYIHENYFSDFSGVLYNDVAFLLLESPVDTITPVAYAKTPADVNAGDLVRAIGWGDTKSNPQFPTILQQVDVNIRSIAEANSLYGFDSLDSRHIAANASGKDSCQGDSGGPLFDADGDEGKPLVIGITSFGAGCAETEPGIYANVGNYKSLIDSFVTSSAIDDPDASIRGKGQPIANGSNRAKRSNGTFLPGRIRGGKSKATTFAIRNSDTSIPLSIESVSSSNKHFTVKRAPSYVFGGDRAAITVKFRAPQKNRKIKSRITVRTNDPVKPVFSFVIQAKSKRNIRLSKSRKIRFPGQGGTNFPGNVGGGNFGIDGSINWR